MELTTLASDIADVILYFHHIQTYFHPNVCLEAKQSVMGVHAIKSGSKFHARSWIMMAATIASHMYQGFKGEISRRVWGHAPPGQFRV